MEKKTTKIIETRTFDSYAEAQDAVSTAKRKQTWYLIGLGISVVATILGIIYLKNCVFDVTDSDAAVICGIIAFFLAIPAYILGGGFGKAIKTAWSLAKLGWIIVPFPFDIITGIGTLILSAFVFIFVPGVFVIMNFWGHYKEYKEAMRHLSFYKEASEQ